VREVPILQISAELDTKLAASCTEVAKSINMEFHVLPGAHHAFDQTQMTELKPDRMGNMMLYNANATEKSRALLRDFLDRHMKK
jgi:dienelactone hydrolase